VGSGSGSVIPSVSSVITEETVGSSDGTVMLQAARPSKTEHANSVNNTFFILLSPQNIKICELSVHGDYIKQKRTKWSKAYE
jgi:hypothetical protein